VCGKKFKFKHYLVSHKLLHTGDKPHMCTWCGMKFTQNANMQKHVRQKHTHEKSHVCRYCGKAFVQAYYLRRHLNSHKEAAMERDTLAAMVETHTGSDEQIGIRTAACRLCSATCKGAKELGEHMVRHHGGLKLEGGEEPNLGLEGSEELVLEVENKEVLVLDLRRHLNSHKEAAMARDPMAAMERDILADTGSDEQIEIQTAACKGEKELGEHMVRHHGGLKLKGGEESELGLEGSEELVLEVENKEVLVLDSILVP
jgi:hypothetical protein